MFSGLNTDSWTYGFAVAARLSDLSAAGAWRVARAGDLASASANGISLVVRPYASTPEAAGEEQPLADERTVLVYEGRVDNREDIASALGRPELAGCSDGVVLAAAFGAWGPRLSAHVIGEFAYAAFDVANRCLVAGQDSLRVRRLFYRAEGDFVWIASNLALMFAQFPDSRPGFSRDALREYFSGFMFPWSGRTIWRGVRELGHGNVLVQRGAALDEETAWRPVDARPLRLETTDEIDEEFRRLLFQSVKAALRSPAPVLCDLSGGYDSSTICAAAAQLARTDARVPAIVTWSYVNDRTNERTFQDAVRAQYGFDSCLLDMNEHLPFKAFTDTEIPSLGFVQFGAIDLAMRQFARARGIRARVTGYAADALFNKGQPAPVYLAEWLREGRIREWARDVTAYLRGGSFSAWHLLRDCSVGSLDVRAGTFRQALPNWFTRDFVRQVQESEGELVQARVRTFRSAARERLYRATLSFVPPHGRMLPDERMPFVYRPLVEFMLGLDWQHLTRPNETRVLMRRALRNLLPEPVRAEGGKSSHGASLLEGLRASWTRIAPLLRGDRLGDLGVVEPKSFQAAVETMRGGFAGLNRQYLNTAVYLELWLNLKTNSLAAQHEPALRRDAKGDRS